MALTEERLQNAVSTDARRVGPPEREPISASLDTDALSRRWALVLPIAWLIAMPLTFALEPAPSSTSPDPWWAVVAGNVLLGAVAMTFVGSWLRREWAPRASLAAASIMSAAVIACPVTGHHAFGAWWVTELALVVGLLALSGAAALRPSA